VPEHERFPEAGRRNRFQNTRHFDEGDEFLHRFDTILSALLCAGTPLEPSDLRRMRIIQAILPRRQQSAAEKARNPVDSVGSRNYVFKERCSTL